MGRFQEITQGIPWPGSWSSFVSNRKRSIIEHHCKMILECGSPSIHHARKNEPEADHEEKPEERAHKKCKGQYLPEIKQHSRKQRKNIYKNDHEPDLPLAQEVIAQCLQNLVLVIWKLNGHRCNNFMFDVKIERVLSINTKPALMKPVWIVRDKIICWNRLLEYEKD